MHTFLIIVFYFLRVIITSLEGNPSLPPTEFEVLIGLAIFALNLRGLLFFRVDTHKVRQLKACNTHSAWFFTLILNEITPIYYKIPEIVFLISFFYFCLWFSKFMALEFYADPEQNNPNLK